MKRFKDEGVLFDQFYGYRIVCCPKCFKPVDLLDLKVTCIQCGFNKEFKPLNSRHTLSILTVELEDFLKIPCCGHTLWAMNLEHLDFLEKYVESDLRERIPNINKSVASRLPQWIKSKNNRNEILKGISKLRLKLKENNYVSNKFLPKEGF